MYRQRFGPWTIPIYILGKKIGNTVTNQPSSEISGLCWLTRIMTAQLKQNSSIWAITALKIEEIFQVISINVIK